jgi:hypothetical protein
MERKDNCFFIISIGYIKFIISINKTITEKATHYCVAHW